MKTTVMIPTYNEVENINNLITEIFTAAPKVNILIVDDNSPDGTAREVKKIAKNFPAKVHLLLRTTTRGRGSAGIDGFKWALKNGAEAVVEMDADFSHNPKDLPKMLSTLKSCDVVVGSRLISGGEDKRGLVRYIITSLGAIYLRTILGITLKDPTSGYRVFRSKVLEKIELDNFISAGTWTAVQETLYRAALFKFRIKEIPIIFVNRDRGESKFNLWILIQSITMAFILRLIFILFKAKRKYGKLR